MGLGLARFGGPVGVDGTCTRGVGALGKATLGRLGCDPDELDDVLRGRLCGWPRTLPFWLTSAQKTTVR